jgi:receptor protein-tyrosine kinase
LGELLPAPIIATIPLRRGQAQNAPIAEAFQLLRANLQLQDPAHETRLMAVTSALPGDGKTTVVKRLAWALAATGAEVVAADCDLRKPRLATSFGVDADMGITSVLLGQCTLEEAELPLESGVRLVPAGPMPPDPAVMLSMPAFGELLERLSRSAEYVLLDTPPVTAGADSSAVAAQVDGVLMVVDMAKSRRDALAAARDQLMKSDARLLGIVLNRVPESQSPYAYYYSSEAGRQRTSDGDRGERPRRRVET